MKAPVSVGNKYRQKYLSSWNERESSDHICHLNRGLKLRTIQIPHEEWSIPPSHYGQLKSSIDLCILHEKYSLSNNEIHHLSTDPGSYRQDQSCSKTPSHLDISATIPPPPAPAKTTPKE
mmetsp:Transcript_19625/g.35291  ORF Transcript_19625/g.35291 Transcript_19625/m.35291 type:complete len:120 (+) Transcript_19625:179-538(+)